MAIEQNEYKNLTPFKAWLMNQINTWGVNNFPFLEEDFDKLTNYGMMMKLMKALNDVITNENLVEDDMSKLYQAFTELQTYISNYFDNLDVQEEINNKLDNMAESGELQEIVGEYLFDFWVSPKSYGAKLDGTTDDTQAIEDALQHGNVKFPSNSNVKIENLSIPNNRIIDFNMSNVKSDGTAIKIGSLSNQSYNKKITIKNANFNIETNAIDLTQCIFINIENCYLPSIKNGNKFINQTNCFNIYIKDCAVGDYTPSVVDNSYGVYVDCVTGEIVGTNNNTNLSIENCLFQRLKEGISLNVTNGLIDTVSMRNIGFSDNDIGVNLNSEQIRNVNINCMRNEFCRKGIVNKGRLILSGMESFSTNEAINNQGNLSISNIDLRGSGIGITSTGSLSISNSVSADNDIIFNIQKAEKPYSQALIIDHTGAPNDYISSIFNYNIFQVGDFNLSDLSKNCPDGSEFTLNTSNGFTINGTNTKYVIPEKGSVILKKINGSWGVLGYGAKTTNDLPTPSAKITVTSQKLRIVGSIVIFNFDITVNTKIDKNAELIFENLPTPSSGSNYTNIGDVAVNINANGQMKTWYGKDLDVGTYRGMIFYVL